MEAEKAKNSESHITSAAAFVEGGIQDAFDDACSICLEEFSESDPSTVTCCRHEFHLQCILEWCQRSSQCPMCWQAISLKDPTSQELLDAVERERKIRVAPGRNATIFHHPTLGDFELQHLPLGVSDVDLEERIIQHLAAAAAMGRAHHLSRREGQRGRPSGHGRPHFLVFSAHPSSPHPEAVPTSRGELEDETERSVSGAVNQPLPRTSVGDESSHQLPIQSDQVSSSAGSSVVPRQVVYFDNRSLGTRSSPIQERAGPSEFQSFSESLKSKWNAVSTRYKESISKNTRGWKDRFFSRTSSVEDSNSDGRREVAGRIDLSHMMARLGTNENHRESRASDSSNAPNANAHMPTIQAQVENVGEYSVDEGNSSASVRAGSVSD